MTDRTAEEMAGSYSHLFGPRGEFTVERIGNLGDAEEALAECFEIIQEVRAYLPTENYPWGLPGRNDVTVADLRAMVNLADSTDGRTLRDWQASLLLAEIDRLQESQLSVQEQAERVKGAYMRGFAEQESQAQRLLAEIDRLQAQLTLADEMARDIEEVHHFPEHGVCRVCMAVASFLKARQ